MQANSKLNNSFATQVYIMNTIGYVLVQISIFLAIHIIIK